MNTNQTADLLAQCNSGIQMGVTAIEDTLSSVKSGDLRRILLRSKQAHQELGSRTHALLNTLGCYDAMQELLRRSAETGFMSANCLKLYALCDSPAAALDYVENADRLTGGISRLEDYAK